MTAGDFAITMIIGYFAAIVASLIGAFAVWAIFVLLGNEYIGIIAGIIAAIVIFVVVGIATFNAARKDK